MKLISQNKNFTLESNDFNYSIVLCPSESKKNKDTGEWYETEKVHYEIIAIPKIINKTIEYFCIGLYESDTECEEIIKEIQSNEQEEYEMPK